MCVKIVSKPSILGYGWCDSSTCMIALHAQLVYFSTTNGLQSQLLVHGLTLSLSPSKGTLCKKTILENISSIGIRITMVGGLATKQSNITYDHNQSLQVKISLKDTQPIFRDKENTTKHIRLQMKKMNSPTSKTKPAKQPSSQKHVSAFHKNMPTKSTSFRNPGM